MSLTSAYCHIIPNPHPNDDLHNGLRELLRIGAVTIITIILIIIAKETAHMLTNYVTYITHDKHHNS